MRKQLASADEGGLPKEELELYAGLLEAHASRDAEYALEKLSDVRYYLHQKDVDVVDYSADHESWFDLLPAEEAGTIRPALAKGGKLLVKGLAAEGR